MQYVRSISGSVSKTWNSINPATLSGAIDVIVVEQEDGSLACSPFHVRFGKFSLLRPYEKKVEFQVNNVKQDYAMKLGEGGEAFFVFETSDNIPEAMQTSPLVSPASSPPLPADGSNLSNLSEPDFLELDAMTGKPRSASVTRPGIAVVSTAASRRPSNLSEYRHALIQALLTGSKVQSRPSLNHQTIIVCDPFLETGPELPLDGKIPRNYSHPRRVQMVVKAQSENACLIP